MALLGFGCVAALLLLNLSLLAPPGLGPGERRTAARGRRALARYASSRMSPACEALHVRGHAAAHILCAHSGPLMQLAAASGRACPAAAKLLARGALYLGLFAPASAQCSSP